MIPDNNNNANRLALLWGEAPVVFALCLLEERKVKNRKSVTSTYPKVTYSDSGPKVT